MPAIYYHTNNDLILPTTSLVKHSFGASDLPAPELIVKRVYERDDSSEEDLYRKFLVFFPIQRIQIDVFGDAVIISFTSNNMSRFLHPRVFFARGGRKNYAAKLAGRVYGARH